MTPSDHSTRSDASDKALAALSELRADVDDPHIAHELLGRLCWLAPDAVLEAVDAARRRRGWLMAGGAYIRSTP